MIRKLSITILFLITGVMTVLAQFDVNPQSFGSFQDSEQTRQDSTAQEEGEKKSVPSVIRTWKLTDYGATMEDTELDTALNFFQVYDPVQQRSFANTFTRNLGGAYLPHELFQP